MLTLRDDIGSKTQWLNANKLTLKTKTKTKFVIFGTKNNLGLTEDMPILIDRVSVFKYLGIMLDECPTFDQHIQYIYNKATTKMGAIRKAREVMDRATEL